MEPTPPFKQIISHLISQPHRSLLVIWLFFRDNIPSLHKAELERRENKKEYNRHKEKVYTALFFKCKIRAKNLQSKYSLAFLEAIDEFLFEYYDLQGDCPPSQIKIDGDTYMFHRRVRRNNKDSAHEKQSGHIRTWLRHRWIIPAKIDGFDISLRRAPDIVYSVCRECLNKQELNVYSGSFPDEIMPDWEKENPAGITTDRLTNMEVRWQNILKSLAQASKNSADMIIFPELTICPELKNRISQWLDDNPDHPFMLILPGTFHVTTYGKIFNFGEVFDRFGRPVISHYKLTTSGSKERPENISTGRRIELLDTPIGLIAMPICLDFCEEGSPFNRLWDEIGAEWLLVPAYGGEKSISAHLRKAQTLQRSHGAVSVVANQDPQGRDKHHGFVCHDQQEPEKITVTHRVIRIKI